MLQSISEQQPTADKLGVPECNNDVSGSETPGSDQKHLHYQKQKSSNSVKANTTNDDSFQVVTKRRQQKQLSKLEDKVSKAAGTAKARKAPIRKRQQSDVNTTDADITGVDDTPRTDQDQNNLASGEESDERNYSGSDPSCIGGFSKKKQQYLEQAIKDRSGVYEFKDNPLVYKKARKRLQNRESAVRSRMKKRDEMQILEDQVTELSQQKAAIEAQNEELKRQNKYWEELFSKQQLQQPLINVGALSQVSNHGPQNQNMAKRNSMPESQELTRSSHELSYIEEGQQLSDPSYENLEMTRADFMKRQKFSNDNGFYGNNSQMTPPADKDNLPLMRNISFGGQLPALSEGKPMNQEEQNYLLDGNEFNVDDVLIDRSTGGRFNNTSFFGGLAMVFGAIGMASFMTASPMEGSAGVSTVYTGGKLVGIAQVPREEPVSIKNQGEEIVEHVVEQSPWQNMQLAFELIMQALMTMPAMAYISFALSLVFMLLWLNPLSYLTGEQQDNRRVQKVRKSSRAHSSAHRRHRQRI